MELRPLLSVIPFGSEFGVNDPGVTTLCYGSPPGRDEKPVEGTEITTMLVKPRDLLKEVLLRVAHPEAFRLAILRSDEAGCSITASLLGMCRLRVDKLLQVRD